MNIFFDMVGCRLNQAEIELMSKEFRQEGHTIVENISDADTVVINTCSVTTQAAADSRQKIRKAGEHLKKKVIVTGCWSTIEPEKASEIPNVIQVVPNEEKNQLVRSYLAQFYNMNIPIQMMDQEPISRSPLPGIRQRTRAFIKVQDGCDNRCTFCITTVARGKSISRREIEIIEDIQAAELGGSQEVVLTGVHLGSWGQELSQPKHLKNLLQLILRETGIPRIRLSSLEPWDIDLEFLSLWENSRLCNHLHLPLQAGNDQTLRRMLRKTTTDSFRELVNNARRLIPNVAITTDLIAGFPGESEEDFLKGLDFIKEMEFSGGHVFSYSEREGTAATRIREKVPHSIRKERNAIIQAVILESSHQYLIGNLGRTEKVLWEAASARTETGWRNSGLTTNYIKVFSETPQRLWNQIDEVLISSVSQDSASGTITPKV